MAQVTPAQQMLQKYLEAEMAVLDGRTVTFNGRTLTMDNIEDIRVGRREWERRVATEQARAAGRNSTHSLASFE